MSCRVGHSESWSFEGSDPPTVNALPGVAQFGYSRVEHRDEPATLTSSIDGLSA